MRRLRRYLHNQNGSSGAARPSTTNAGESAEVERLRRSPHTQSGGAGTLPQAGFSPGPSVPQEFTTVDDPPSYQQDQIEQLRDELNQVRLQLSQVQARSNNPPQPESSGQAPAPPDAEGSTSSRAILAQDQQNSEVTTTQTEESEASAWLDQQGWDLKGSLFAVNRDKALHWAAGKGHTAAVKYLVKNGASGTKITIMDGAAVDILDKSALASAVLANHATIVQILLEQATPETLQMDNALRLAARECYVGIVQTLLTKWPREAWSESYSREKALSEAAKQGNETIVRLILKEGVSYKVQADMGPYHSPLCSAIDAGQTNIVQLLLEDPSQACEEFKTGLGAFALSAAAKSNNRPLIENLLARGVIAERTSMFWAAHYGNESLVRHILNAGGDPNSVFEAAVGSNNRDLIQMLLDHGANAGPGLKASAHNGNLSITQLLLDYGANVNQQYEKKLTPLHAAAARGHSEVLNLLLDRGADTSAEDREGRTPFYFAIISGDVATLQLLYTHPAAKPPGSKAGHSEEAFVRAVEKGATETVQLLLDKGFKFKLNAGDDEKLLGTAAKNGSASMVALLLDRGANIDGADRRGRQALHLAAEHGHYQIVKLLLDRGADPMAKNRLGNTAKYWAAKNDHKDIVRLLDEACARGGRLSSVKATGSNKSTSTEKKAPSDKLQSENKKSTTSPTKVSGTSARQQEDFTDPSILRWD